MRETTFNRARVIRYLLWAFAPAYLIQFGAAYLYRRGDRTIAQLIIAAMMFVPALAVRLAGGRFNGMGWRIRIRQQARALLIAWFAPMALTLAGAGLYFLFFPAHFDLTGAYIALTGGQDALSQMKAQGLTYPMVLLVNAVGGITYAPLINAFVALGEEIGWRGFLYPQLKAGFGRRRGWLLGGAIWGAWHWPLIALIGYEYGAAAGNPAGYAGFPVSGMLLFCVITVGWGILHDWLYEMSGSIWLPSLLHGAINAAATLPLSVCLTDTGSARLLGPAPVGLMAALPFLLIAAAIFFRSQNAPGK